MDVVVSGAVLVPPTGNRVLNQIPAGDGGESSREQAVPDDGAPLHRSANCGGRETTSPSGFSCSRRQSRLPDPQKKKKKSGKKQRRGWCGSGNYTRAVRWRLCECGGTGVEAKRK